MKDKSGKEKSQKQGKSQREKFIEAAKELGCEDNDNGYGAVLREVAKQKPRKKRKL